MLNLFQHLIYLLLSQNLPVLLCHPPYVRGIKRELLRPVVVFNSPIPCPFHWGLIYGTHGHSASPIGIRTHRTV